MFPECVWGKFALDTLSEILPEKLAESEEDLLEHRTDGADTFETLYIGCEKFPQADISPVAVDTGGIM